MSQLGDLSRRRLLFGGAPSAPARCSPACTVQRHDDTSDTGNQVNGNADNAAPGKAVTIGFSAPAADHGWIRGHHRQRHKPGEEVLTT